MRPTDLLARNAKNCLGLLVRDFPAGAQWRQLFVAWQTVQRAAGLSYSKATFCRILQRLAALRLAEKIDEGQGEHATWRPTFGIVDEPKQELPTGELEHVLQRALAQLGRGR
jgi:hypothetical protein